MKHEARVWILRPQIKAGGYGVPLVTQALRRQVGFLEPVGLLDRPVSVISTERLCLSD